MNILKMKYKGITFMEVLVACFVIAVIAFFAYPRYGEMMRNSRETALAQELKVLRDGIYMYVLKNGTYPKSISELEEKGFIKIDGQSEEKLKITYIKKSKVGEYLDPFRNPYQYNPEKGAVWSITQGYEEY